MSFKLVGGMSVEVDSGTFDGDDALYRVTVSSSKGDLATFEVWAGSARVAVIKALFCDAQAVKL